MKTKLRCQNNEMVVNRIDELSVCCEIHFGASTLQLRF